MVDLLLVCFINQLIYIFQFEYWSADGGVKMHAAHAKSGEPPVKLVTTVYGDKPVDPISVTDFFELNERRYRYQQAYGEYWNGTAAHTRSGRPVDAVIMPTYPGSSFRPGEGLYFGQYRS
jgi:amidase